MEYLRTEEADIAEVMRQVHGITNSGKLVKRVLNYVQKFPQVMGDGEYGREEEHMPRLPPGFIGMMVMGSKYSLNIRLSTIVLLAFLLDMGFSKGVASLALGMSGFPLQTLQKITDTQKCLVADILVGKKTIPKDFDYFGRECVQNDIECPFRDLHQCRRPLKSVEDGLQDLESKQVVNRVGGAFRISF